MQGIVSQGPRWPFSICQRVLGAFCDCLFPSSHIDRTRQAKNIENDSMVAQLLKDETVTGQDRAAYEQTIKDCATSSFIGKKLNRVIPHSSNDVLRFDLQSRH